jgi:type I restriction enzyme S subunit
MSFGEDIVKIVEENATGLLGKHSSWHRVPAAQVIEIINGFPFESKGFNNEKGTPVLRIRDILKGKTKTFFEGKVDPKACYVSNGDIVIGMDGDFNSCIWQGGLVLLNQRVCKVETNQAFYDQKFFSYLLPGYLRAIHAQTSAVTVKHLSSNTIKEIPLPLPPFNEQKRIVDKIEQLFSNLDEGEALLKQVQKQLGTYRQSVLKAAVTGKLIGLDANEWPEQTVGQLLKDIRYGTAKKCLFDPSKTPVLRIPNVAGGKIDLSDLKHTDFSETELEKLRLEYGDLLIVRSNGSVSLVGLSAMVTKQAVGCAYAGYLIRLRLKQDILLPDFLNLYLHSPIVRGRIELQARSTSGVHNINSNEVKSIPLRVPPLQHQEEIVSKVDDIFSQIDVLENWCATELARSATLRQSILKDAFSGKLVPQDPTDEPAHELLKCIQAERAKATKQKSSALPRPRGRWKNSDKESTEE